MRSSEFISTALLLSVLLCQSGCGGSILFDCDEKTLGTQASPDRRWEAEVLSVGCGATTPLAIQVRVRRLGFPLWLSRPHVVSVAETTEVPRLSWMDGRTLEISWRPSARIFRKATGWGHVEISYPSWDEAETPVEVPSPTKGR